jgi:GNAT superfamily N-acetyltransferase
MTRGPHKLNLRFEELTRSRTFQIPELAESAERNTWTPDRKQYRVWLNNREAAFVTFDAFWPDRLVLYEMVVAKDLRRKGIGSAIIHFAIELAKQLNKPRLTVLVGQIGDLTTKELRAFYAGCGLTPATGDPNAFEIVVTI